MTGTPSWKIDTDQSRTIQSYPKLEGATNADVVIIGAGITGILTAYLCAKSGKSVVVLEKSKILDGATQCTTAFITEVIDTEPEQLLKVYGEKTSRRIFKSHHEAIDLIESIVNEEKIDCGFVRVSDYVYARDDDEIVTLENQCIAYHEAGVEATVSAKSLPGFENQGYIEIKDQAKFHPLKFLYALAEIAAKDGVRFFEETQAAAISGSDVVCASGAVATGSTIVSATYSPFGEPKGLYFKKGMYQSYILELQLPKNTIAEGIYEDMANPYHYFRVDRMEDHDHVLLGGEDHRSDYALDPEKPLRALEEYAHKIFAKVQHDIVNRWDGPILEPSDGLALIGKYGERNHLFASGFSGNGMTYAGIAAMTFRDLVTDKVAEYEDIYSPERSMNPKALAYKAKDYGGEFVRGALKNAFRKK